MPKPPNVSRSDHKSVTKLHYSGAIDEAGITMLSSQYSPTPIRSVAATEEIDFHGAAIVDSSGNEVPITSAMVDSALQQARDFLCPNQVVWSGDTCRSN